MNSNIRTQEALAQARSLKAELDELRAMKQRLMHWAMELEAPKDRLENGGTGVGMQIAAELRRRMAGK